MGKGIILCVDDEEAVVKTETETLRAFGYEVISSTSPVRALEMFKKQANDISLVIADVVMPHITGSALAEEIHFTSPDTPVILATEFTQIISTELTEKAAQIGITGILAKPFRIHELREAVVNAFRIRNTDIARLAG